MARLRKIYTEHFPVKGFTAVTVLLWCFIRRDESGKFGRQAETHENVHLAQQLELLIVGFYFLYGLEWLVKFVAYRSARVAYYSVSFEQEAYRNQSVGGYLESRRHYAWISFLFKKYSR